MEVKRPPDPFAPCDVDARVQAIRGETQLPPEKRPGRDFYAEFSQSTQRRIAAANRDVDEIQSEMLEYGWAKDGPKHIPKQKKLLKTFMRQLNQSQRDSQEEFIKGILVASHLKDEHIKSKRTI